MEVAAFVANVVGFVVVIVVWGDGDGDEDDTADDIGGVAADDNKDGFIVFGIPHIRDSVVLTTFRLGLLGSQIFALSCGDIGLLDELLLSLRLPAGGADDDNDGNCCANTRVLLQIAKTSIPTRNENAMKIKVVWFI